MICLVYVSSLFSSLPRKWIDSDLDPLAPNAALHPARLQARLQTLDPKRIRPSHFQNDVHIRHWLSLADCNCRAQSRFFLFHILFILVLVVCISPKPHNRRCTCYRKSPAQNQRSRPRRERAACACCAETFQCRRARGAGRYCSVFVQGARGGEGKGVSVEVSALTILFFFFLIWVCFVVNNIVMDVTD
jgi:hypothetical protein